MEEDKEILMPKEQDTSTGDFSTYDELILPKNLTEKQIHEIFENYRRVIDELAKRIGREQDKTNELEKRFIELENKNKDIKRNLEEITSRNIEILGIFASIIALVIIDVSIVKSVKSFLSAILLITGLTASVASILSLVHFFFSPQDKKKLSWGFYISLFIIGGLIILGIKAYCHKWF